MPASDDMMDDQGLTGAASKAAPLVGSEPMPSILLVDEEQQVREDIKLLIGDLYAIRSVGSIAEGRDCILAHDIEVVLLDLEFQGVDEGYDFLEHLQTHYPEIPVIMMSRYEKPSYVVKAMRLGAVGYLGKNPNRSELDLSLRTALELRNSRIRIRAFTGDGERDEVLAGNSSISTRIRQEIKRFGSFDRPVLITGENGTGKNLCARVIHNLSANRDEPFISVNCAAFTSTLLASELFGHEQGAFEDAPRRRVGRLQEVGRGTIHLDEIAEMSIETQHMLSRAVTEKSFRPLGSRQIIPLRARIIAASNRDLVREVVDRRFLQTLLIQLNVLPLNLPPLRERVEDIEVLCQHLIYRKSVEMKRPVPLLSRGALRLLQRQSWQGNVRELLGVIENALVHCQDNRLEESCFKLIPQDEYSGLIYEDAKEIAMERFQRSYVTPVLKATNGSITRACEIMGLPRQTLYRIMQRLGLNKDEFRQR
jgi:DNA-binding NtrC family response regulator